MNYHANKKCKYSLGKELDIYFKYKHKDSR